MEWNAPRIFEINMTNNVVGDRQVYYKNGRAPVVLLI
jgi:hypothetical protein